MLTYLQKYDEDRINTVSFFRELDKQVEDADDLDKYNGTPLIQRSGININNFDNVD